MALTVYLTLKANGADVEGESTVRSLDRENTIECFSFSNDSKTGFDERGIPSGRIASTGMKFRKVFDKSSPLLQKALDFNEVLEGNFRFFRPSQDGTEEHFFTITFANGRLARINRRSLGNRDPDFMAMPAYENVKIIAGEVTWTNVSGGQEHTTEFFAPPK